MKTKKILLVASLVLMVGIVACKKDHEIPTGKVFNSETGGDTIVPGGDDNHEYVDLGLPSGTLWAACNLGAKSPEGYGSYYAWGETTTKENYAWASYKYAKGNSWDDPRLTKYCNDPDYGNIGFSDVLNTLLPEDDAATINWGRNWCMPTKDQWQELLDNTSVRETIQNGVHGRLFTAENGNMLFLPASGYRWGNVQSDIGNKGYYWSSTLSSSSPIDACFLSFYSNHCYVVDGTLRIWGRTIRPVRSAGPKNNMSVSI